MTKKARVTWSVVCWVCGSHFHSHRQDAQTCGPRCRKRLARRRKAGVEGVHPQAGHVSSYRERGTIFATQLTGTTQRDYQLGTRPTDEQGNYTRRKRGPGRFRQG